MQLLAAQQGRADAFEVVELNLALTHAHHQHAAANLLGGVLRRAQQRVESLHQRLDVRRQDAARVQVGEQMLHGC